MRVKVSIISNTRGANLAWRDVKVPMDIPPATLHTHPGLHTWRDVKTPLDLGCIWRLHEGRSHLARCEDASGLGLHMEAA